MTPPEHVADLEASLRNTTGSITWITQARRGGYRIGLIKPANLDTAETLALLELLDQADRFGNTPRVVWAEFDRRPS